MVTVLFYGMWEIWKIRCRMKFEEEPFEKNCVEGLDILVVKRGKRLRWNVDGSCRGHHASAGGGIVRDRICIESLFNI